MSSRAARLLPVFQGGVARAPTVTITSGESDPTTTNPFEITITFSRDVTGFTVGDLTVSANASAGNFAGSGSVYTADITAIEIGTVTVDIAEDVVNEGNAAASQFSIFMSQLAAPATSPTYGAEDVTNGDMETGDPPDNWTAGNSATLSSVADERTGGMGAASMSLVNGAASFGYAYQTLDTLKGNFVATWFYGKKVDANAVLQIRISAAGTAVAQINISSTSWLAGGPVAALLLDDNYVIVIGIGSTTIGHECRADDFSVKPITFASMIGKAGTSTSKGGTYQCTPTASNSLCGMLLNYLDADNWVALYIDRTLAAARIVSNIAGTMTLAKNDSIAYGAGQVLKVVVTGSTYELFYNGVSKGTCVIDNGGMGYDVYALNPIATNNPGTIMVNP